MSVHTVNFFSSMFICLRVTIFSRDLAVKTVTEIQQMLPPTPVLFPSIAFHPLEFLTCLKHVENRFQVDDKSLKLASRFYSFHDSFVCDLTVPASFIPARRPCAADTVPGIYSNIGRERITKQIQSFHDNMPLCCQVRKPSM